MKKLMMTLAVSLAATALIADVTSVNVVGYQTIALALEEFTHVAPTFITVGGSAQITLADLTGDFAEFDSIQTMDEDGATANEYFWLVEGSAAPEAGETGWYADDFETPAGSVVIAAGSSVLYSSQGASELILSGEVNTNDVEVASGEGFTVTGNPFPVDTTLNAIQFVGIAEFCSVQFMDGDGATAAEYFWLEEGSAAPEAGETGWYADDFETPVGSTVVAAGKGFLFSEQGAGTTITFDSPL